jgi:mitogen-activated protein kinase kinase kinase 13
MAQQRRPAHRVASAAIVPNAISRRKLQARRDPRSHRRAFTISSPFPHPPSSHASVASSSPPSSSRAVLVPLQFNLRRLPSRLFSESKESMHDGVPTGSKRKRVVSGSENGLANGRSLEGSRVKRRRATLESSDEEVASEMDVDGHPRWELTDSDASDDDGLDSCESSSLSRPPPVVYRLYFIADNYLINEAPPRRLLRLRKDELVRLYSAAGLAEDAELLTKHEIIDCLITARDDIASLPPSSPPDAGGSGSSDYSSDGGNIAGGEETDFAHRFRNGLTRRNTMLDLGRRARRPPNDRCYTLPTIQTNPDRYPTRTAGPSKAPSAPRRYVYCPPFSCFDV